MKDNSQEILNLFNQKVQVALTKAGEFVKTEAKIRTPVDTGLLRSSIDYNVKEQEKTVEVGTNTEYAIYVEKGTTRQKAQPYLTPAIEENVRTIENLIKGVFKR